MKIKMKINIRRRGGRKKFFLIFISLFIYHIYYTLTFKQWEENTIPSFS
jgi:hypothetical protein